MKFERFVSDPPVSPYAPQWDFKLGIQCAEDIDTNSLSKFLLSKESEVKKIPVHIMISMMVMEKEYLMDTLD